MDEIKVMVLMYENDINLDEERLIYRGLKRELLEIVGDEELLNGHYGVINLPVDGVNKELRIEQTILDYEGTDKLKYICYQVVPNK